MVRTGIFIEVPQSRLFLTEARQASHQWLAQERGSDLYYCNCFSEFPSCALPVRSQILEIMRSGNIKMRRILSFFLSHQSNDLSYNNIGKKTK